MLTPKRITASVGKTVKFTCKSYEYVWWTFQGRSLPSNAYRNRLTILGPEWLIIRDVRLDNTGIYTCHRDAASIIHHDQGILIVTGKS